MTSLPWILWTVATSVCCFWWVCHAARCRTASSAGAATLCAASRDKSTLDEPHREDAQRNRHPPRTDALTGLSNEFSMQESLRRMFALMSRYGHSFSVVLFDLDNSTAPLPSASDQQLCELAQLLDSTIREMDSVYRLAGQQLAVLLPETDLEGAVTFAQRVHREVWEKLHLRVGIGLSSARDDDSLRSLADRMAVALFAAQSDGGSIYRHTGQHIEAVEAPTCDVTEDQLVCSG